MAADQSLGAYSPLPTPPQSRVEEYIGFPQPQNNALLLSELDYRFGWRWLLPPRDNDRVALVGFSEDEEVFWRDVMAPTCGFVEALAEANVWVVNGDRGGIGRDDVMRNFSRVNVVSVVGSGKSMSWWRQAMFRHFPVVREYGLLPSGNPRIILPLDSPKHATTALRLHRPGRCAARMVLVAIRVLAYFGNFSLLRRRLLCIALRDESCLPRGAITAGLAARLPEARGGFALYLGTAGRNRKTVILPVTDFPRVVLKAAETPNACRALRNELSVLHALATSPLKPNVPSVWDVVECGDTLTLYQEYRQRRLIWGSRYREAVVEFMAKLSAQNRRSQSLTSILTEGCLEWGDRRSGSGGSVFSALMRRLERAAAKGVMLWAHRSHGDFAPWNCAWTKKGLFVFDWEESRECATAFGDAFYFVVAPAVLISGQNDDPAKVTHEALRLATDVAAKVGLPVEDLRIYWALWLLERAAKDNMPLYGQLVAELERKWG